MYDIESNTWVAARESSEVTIGLTSLLSAIAGKFNKINLRSPGTRVERGNSLGTLESLKLVAPIPSPISGTVLASNDDIVRRPKIVNDSPYEKGWIAKMTPLRLEDERLMLSSITQASTAFRRRISEFGVRCFKAFPDHEMYEIGTECSAVLLHLGELLRTVPVGDAVHLVTDDPTSHVEMVRWTDQTRNELADWRKERNLFHFIVRKKP